MMKSAGDGAARPLLLSYSANFGRHCLFCGKPLQGRGLHCSNSCRRAYQNQRRKRERKAEARRRGLALSFCPVCGVPMLTSQREDGGKACSSCCRAIRSRRRALGLPVFEHPPNYDLGLLLADLPRDPWQAHDVNEEEEAAIWENALLSPIPPEVLHRLED